MAEKSVFISYHRDSEAGAGLARALELALDKRGYDVFLDVDSIAAGLWSPQIEYELPRRKHFLFILTPGVLERCANPDNWMRREYDLAVATRRNIVPVRSAGFDDALERSRCPPAMQGIFAYQMARVGLATFKKDFLEFVERFLEAAVGKPGTKPVHRVPVGEPVEEGGAGPRRSRTWVAKARLVLLVCGLVFGGWLVLKEAPPQQEPGPAPAPVLLAIDQRTAPAEAPSPLSGTPKVAPAVAEIEVPAAVPGNPGSKASGEPEPQPTAAAPAEVTVEPSKPIVTVPPPPPPRAVVEQPARRDPVPPPASQRRLRSGDLWVSPSGIAFRFVLAGTYSIGSPANEPGRFYDETRHQVRLSRGFWLAETELTQGQWKQLVARNPSHFSACGDDCPVENVSWYEAVGFANALSRREGVEQCYRLNCSGLMGSYGYTCTSVEFVGFECAGYRLPTESEWEVAARAGRETAPDLGSAAWYSYNSGARTHAVTGGRTHAVRGKSRNPWDLYDMLGNVYEWVWDRGGAYPTGVVSDPVGPEDGSLRVFRGGSWDSIAQRVRAAYRGWDGPGNRDSRLGFRFARGQGRGAPSAEPQE